jgi:outer membrane protein TolC
MKSTMKSTWLFPAATCLFCVHASMMSAQGSPGPRVPLQLGALQQAALAADPRTRELHLQADQTDLRLRNIEAEHLPSLTAQGQAQYQSDVPTAPFTLPTGQPLFAPSKDTYDASLRVDQRLVDLTIRPRLAVERAQLSEAQARVRTSVFGLRQEVNDAFFAAALLQQQAGALSATLADLETRLRETTARVREGTALVSDAAEVEATLLQRRQDEAELGANRATALARLGELTGRAITEDDVLALPDLGTAVTQARDQLTDIHARPEYEQFQRSRTRLARQGDAAVAQERPQVSAFARVGYGKPGLNFISHEFEPYGLAGLQVQWKAWTWGTAGREREALVVQQQIVEAEQAAFTDSLRRAIQGDLATIDRLQSTLTLDDQIIALREAVERSARSRFQEAVVTASEYLDRSSELLGARFTRASHRVELVEASARFLTTLGLEVR